MIHFSYTRQYEGQFYKTGSFNNSDWVTLCGAEVDYDTDMKDGPVCNECIKVMWQEQYRRNTLRGVRIEDTQEEEQGHLRDDSHLSPLYLSSYEREA
tara:strand:- start:584 stop:874 length:291 start_codon:yes stop_codon:yes gene_type:complete